MQLLTQQYLRSGKTLQDLKDDFAISARVNESLGVVTLNYNQILSPMGNPVVQECRALTLNLEDWSVVSWAMPKFFNHGDSHVPETFDYDNFKAYEKLDGSLIHFYHLPGGWQCGTRSVPDAECSVDDTGLTFKQLVLKAITEMGYTWDTFVAQLDPHNCYGFELTTPPNRVVVNYEDYRLTLLTVRDLTSLTEYAVEQWAQEHGYLAPVVALHDSCSITEIQSRAQQRDPMEHEGFVLVDPSFNRVKVKSEAYFFLSSRRDRLTKSNRARIELILADAADDVLPSLNAYQQQRILDLQVKLQQAVFSVERLWASFKAIETDKDFALAVVPTGWQAPLFALRKGKVDSVLAFFRGVSSRNVLNYLKVEDIEEEAV